MYTEPMARIRRIAGPAAAIWLVVQTATLVLVPAFFIAGSQAAPLECTCMHDGTHRDCPMHHASPMGARICIQTTDPAGFAVLGSMLGHLGGVIPSSLETLHLTPPPLAARTAALRHPRTPAPPNPPPPRV